MKVNLENRIKELEYALEALPRVKISEDTVAVATDRDGRTFEFTDVPELNDESWKTKKGTYKVLPNSNWKNSLITLTLDQIKEHNKSIKQEQ